MPNLDVVHFNGGFFLVLLNGMHFIYIKGSKSSAKSGEGKKETEAEQPDADGGEKKVPMQK